MCWRRRPRLVPSFPDPPKAVGRAQLPGKTPHQRLIGRRVDADLFLRQADCQIGGMRRQLAPRRFYRRCDFLLRGRDDLARVFFGSGLNARFFGSAFLFGGVPASCRSRHPASAGALRFRPASPRLFAGLLRFLHGLLDGRRAVAEHSRQDTCARPRRMTP